MSGARDSQQTKGGLGVQEAQVWAQYCTMELGRGWLFQMMSTGGNQDWMSSLLYGMGDANRGTGKHTHTPGFGLQNQGRQNERGEGWGREKISVDNGGGVATEVCKTYP